MSKKSKKKLMITLSVVAVIIIGGLTAGYIAINRMFSALSGSFYQVTLSEPGEKEEGSEASPPPTLEPNETGGADENIASETKKPPVKEPSPTPSGKNEVPYFQEPSKEAIESVPFSDKVSVLSILSKNLSPAEYKELIGMLSGGVTTEEFKRARQILREKVTGEDKEKILEYYNEYYDQYKSQLK